MGRISRILTGFFAEDDGKSGLYEKADGTVWYRKPDGSEAEVGNGGSQPSIETLGPFAVAWDDSGIETARGTLLTALPAGALFIESRCIVHEKFSLASAPQLVLVAEFGDLHDYWNLADIWEVGQLAITDGLAGAAAAAGDNTNPVGAFFAATGNIRARLTAVDGQGSADVYLIVGTP